MDGTQFLVQWDEHPSHLATRLGYLLEHQSLVDVTLMCNTHTLKVHRAVLAACSPYFERQLGSHPLIVLKDMKFSVLKSLVEFMYCGETSVSEENLTPLLEAAKFFEVKGLSSMTKETVCSPNSTNPTKTFNGTIATPTTSGYGRGGCGNRGRGRGRGRPPLNTTTKIGSPTESAQILLSLSGNTNSPQLFTTSKNVKIDPSVVQGGVENKISPKLGFEPRRRGRKRGALNTAFRDRLMRDADTQMAIENLKRDLSDDGDLVGSPLLSSLLSKQETDDKTYMNAIKNIGLPTNVPILVDNGQGKLVTLSEDVLKTVIDNGDGSVQLHLGPAPKTRNQSEEEIVTGIGSSIDIKTDHEDTINEEMLQSLKKGAVSEAENEPEAVVLFEVTDNKKVEKYVVSAKEVSLLKALNEQLTKQKKELADITRNNLSTIDVAGTNTKVAELKLKIGKTKSILSEVVGYAQGLREKLKSIETSQDNKSQMVQLEFIDGNGEKIEGYQVTGTLVDKKDGGKDEFLGLFDMVCEGNNEGPLLTEGAKEEEEQPEEARIPYEIEAMINDDNSNNIVIEDKNQEYKYIIDNDGNVMNQEENNYVVYEESEGVMYDDGTEESVLPSIGDETGADFVVSEPQTEYIVYDEKGHELTDDSMKSMGVDGARYIVETYNPPQSDEEIDKEDNEEVVANIQGLAGEVEEDEEDHGQMVAHDQEEEEDEEEEVVVRETHDDESFVIYPESEVVHHVTDVKEVVGDCCDEDLQNATDALCPITSSATSTPNDIVEDDLDNNITSTHLLQNSHHRHHQPHHQHHHQPHHLQQQHHHPHHHHTHPNQIARRTRSSSGSLNGETMGCSVKRRDSTESDNSDRLIDKKRRIDPTLTDESL